MKFIDTKNAKLQKEKIILGIDPGTNIMGYGVLSIVNNKMTSPSMGIVKLTGDNYGLKLKQIFERVTQLIEDYHPDEFAIEAPFYGKNVQSMLKLGRAQGVSMAAALVKEIPIAEYSPRKIKKAITGSGAASKEQVASMIKTLIHIETLPKHLDATDGLAAAICHHFQSSSVVQSGAKGGWSSFVNQNPNRVR